MKIKKFAIFCLISACSFNSHAASWQSALTFIKTMQSEASAWAVNVKQTSIGAHQESQSELNSKKQLATAIGAINMSDRVAKTAISFNPEIGQPTSIKCEAQTQGKIFVESVGQRDRDAAKLMATYSSNRVSSRANAVYEALDMHKSNYCTVTEARQGMCELTPNGMQAWDIDYSGAFDQKTLSELSELAAYAYVAMVTDVRAEAQIDCKSVGCATAQSHQIASSAFASMAANSLVGQVTDRRVLVLD